MARPLRAVVLALCLGVHGCADVEGGAVELSWKLRAMTGSDRTFLDCVVQLQPTTALVQVTHIRLDWEVDGIRGRRQWPCGDDHGVTGFELPAGTALLWVSPVCANGDAAPGTYTAPAPEQRQVIVGNTINLQGVELLLEVTSCDLQPCICQ